MKNTGALSQTPLLSLIERSKEHCAKLRFAGGIDFLH